MYNRKLAALYRDYVHVLVEDGMSYQDASLTNLKDRTDRMITLGDTLERIAPELPERAERFATQIIQRAGHIPLVVHGGECPDCGACVDEHDTFCWDCGKRFTQSPGRKE